MALTDLKSILSNFRKPMNTVPLTSKGKDKTTPVKPSTLDETLQQTSVYSPTSSNKNLTDLSKTQFKSNVSIVKLGVNELLPTITPNTSISANKNETSNIVIVKSTPGDSNNTSPVNTVSVVQDRLLNILNSNLNVDSIPVKYTVSDNLISDSSNLNLDYTPPKYINTPSFLQLSPGGSGVMINASNLNIDSIPNKYQNIVNLGQFNPNKPVFSTLDIDSIPNKYQVSGVLLTDTSNLNVDSIPNKYQNIVNLGQFNPFNAGQSLLDINSIPVKYQVSGQLLTDISNLNVDSIPNKYQNIVNLGQFNPFNTSQSELDVNSIPNKYQNIVNLGQFNPFNSSLSELDVNSIPNKYQNIVNLGQFNPSVPAASLYDIDSIPNKYSTLVGNGKFTDDNTIIGNRWVGNTPPAVNYFKPDALQGSVGFTTKMDTTQFVGIIGNEYLFTNNIQQPLGTGIAKLSNQLGLGSVFNYTDGGAPKTKTFTVDGYSALKKYGDSVKSNNSNPNDSLLYKVSTEENSPSAIDLQYAKFNLQDDSYNPFYTNQPYVLRGIQRKGNKSLQRWGGSALADDGLIRGGIAASVERSAFDVARLSQWIASPKGLLWVTKQVGLGLSNPIVETGTAVPLPVGQTRIHSGLSSLLSVPTTAFGVHFTRHGIPFANEIASYENVQLLNQIPLTGGGNRLVNLKNTVFGVDALIGNQLFGDNPLGKFGGPNSTYGIGFTKATRFVDTTEGTIPGIHILVKRSLLRGLENVGSVVRDTNNYIPIYSIGSQYASVLSKARISTGMDDTNKRSTNNVDEQSSAKPGERTSLSTRTKNNGEGLPGLLPNVIREAFEVDKPNPFNRQPDIDRKTPTTPTINSAYYGLDSIKNYATIAYGRIPTGPGPIAGFNDFRKTIEETTEAKYIGRSTVSKYDENNLVSKGWGTHGAVGADRSDYTVMPTPAGSRGDKVNVIDFIQKQRLTDKLAKGDYTELSGSLIAKDFIAFYFAGPKHHDTGPGDDVMVFRANIQGFTDSFSPEWNPISIMGRADKAYIYTGFERSVSFTFTAAATSREEMKPMWRKLNYLATYTMPDYNTSGRLLGPFMRMTIGNLFQNTPGFLESFSISIPDEATWELGGDNDMLQLPMMAEVSITFKVLSDYRPQKLGRAYSLSKLGKHGDNNNWLSANSSLPTTIDSDKTQTGDKKLATDTTPADSRTDTTATDRNSAPLGNLGNQMTNADI